MARIHQIERTPAGWHCYVCRWTWPHGVQGYCPGVPRYAPDAVPAQLQTKTQLRALGLQPGGPAQGCYHVPNTSRWCWLYALPAAVPAAPTVRQQVRRDHLWAAGEISQIVRQVRTEARDDPM